MRSSVKFDILISDFEPEGDMVKRADKDKVITEFFRRYDNGPNSVIQSIGTNEAKGTLRVVVYKPNAVGIKFPKTILGWKLDLVFSENKIRPL